jgi:hypothetical protein
MENAETTKVKAEYAKAKSEIANLMGFFECELAKEPKEVNWGHIGSLYHIRRNLLETLSFMSGIEIKHIENTLEETHA